MKTKRLALISSLAATVLIASPVLGAQQKKSKATSQTRPQRMTPRTTQVTQANQRGINSSTRGTRHYMGGQRYVGTRQYSGGRYYTQNRFAGRGYYGGTGYYYGGPRYSYGGSYYPYNGSYGYYPYGYNGSYYYGSNYGSYPYSYYRGYPDSYSYYQRGYGGYDDATVAAVQRRLGELGYDVGVVDGVVGPQTRAAIAAFQSTHGMVADGMITTRLLDRMGLT
ncbi:MAG: peptidoglycan-binding protein [Verrucomicrobia bacterium]|nr:peptidoglycan-binding protein [Verrucomicrobiota bacterium]